MSNEIRRMSRIVSVIRELVEPDLPLQQLALLLLIAEAGEEGITMPEAAVKLNMGQTSVSKNAKALSRYAEDRGGTLVIKGLELIEARPDLLERRRLRMSITPKGVQLLDRVVEEVRHVGVQAR